MTEVDRAQGQQQAAQMQQAAQTLIDLTRDAADGKPVVLVSVGTDHHQFDRLIEWVDRWLAAGAGDRVRCVVQHGYSRTPERAEAAPLLSHSEVQGLMRRAIAVVCHGGPTTIMETRRRRLVPLVVARRGELGEHVDNHQELFAQRMSDAGLIKLLQTEQDLHAALDAAVADPASHVITAADAGADAVMASAAAFGELVAELAAGRAAKGAAGLPRVLFIGGSGRSGTTLVERLLARADGVHAAGELVHLWQRGLVDGERCGCGQPFADCGFWQRVGELAYGEGSWAGLDPEWTLATRWAVDRTRRVPALVAPRVATARWQRRMRVWARHVSRLYRGIAEAAAELAPVPPGGRAVLIDSSKHLSYALLLRRASVDLRVLRVVRDPRAVAYAWSKTRTRPEVLAGSPADAQMPRFGPWKSTVLWLVNTVGYALLRLVRVPTLSIRYEDLCADPVGTLTRVLDFAGVEPEQLKPLHDWPDGRTVDLAPDHTVAGNPMRFTTGLITLRQDDQWRTALPRRRRWLVTALTWPWLLAYGYPLRVRRPTR